MASMTALHTIHVDAGVGVPEALEHLVRVLRVKPDPTAADGIERKVRYAYDEARAADSQDFETFASVVRLQTSRLPNLKAAHLRRTKSYSRRYDVRVLAYRCIRTLRYLFS